MPAARELDFMGCRLPRLKPGQHSQTPALSEPEMKRLQTVALGLVVAAVGLWTAAQIGNAVFPSGEVTELKERVITGTFWRWLSAAVIFMSVVLSTLALLERLSLRVTATCLIVLLGLTALVFTSGMRTPWRLIECGNFALFVPRDAQLLEASLGYRIRTQGQILALAVTSFGAISDSSHERFRNLSGINVIGHVSGPGRDTFYLSVFGSDQPPHDMLMLTHDGSMYEDHLLVERIMLLAEKRGNHESRDGPARRITCRSGDAM